jgi:hypothetical protein
VPRRTVLTEHHVPDGAMLARLAEGFGQRGDFGTAGGPSGT